MRAKIQYTDNFNQIKIAKKKVRIELYDKYDYDLKSILFEKIGLLLLLLYTRKEGKERKKKNVLREELDPSSCCVCCITPR